MKYAAFIIVLFLTVAGLNAQPIENLRNQKQKAAAEIKFTNQLIAKAKKTEKASLNRLRLINNKIYQRNKIITSLNSETSIYQELINDNHMVVNLLKDDLLVIKNEYAEMVRFAYKNRNSYDKIIFLLSANDFNQAYKRHLYLKQYADYRKNQINTIEAVQKLLEEKSADLEKLRIEKEKSLKEEQKEKLQLSDEKLQQNNYVKKLQKEQRNLRQKLKKQQKIEDELEKTIQTIIEQEARKLRQDGKPGFALTPEQKLVGNNFEQNKTRIPWPVDRGIITEHFGVHKHPVLKNITIKNNGVDITTEPGLKARAVFKGEVSKVFGITGGNMAVIIRHGKYLTVYSNLEEVTVKKGENVVTKQNIGTIFSDSKESDKTTLKFQIWMENHKMDPENWIAK
jgi:septal ring factor EnvC (AmiA/AmiB activator)